MKRLYGFLFIFCVLIFSTNRETVAGTWTEDFSNNHLNPWTKREHQRERVTWHSINGRLYVQTKPFCNGNLNLDGKFPLKTHYTLAFTAFPIETDKLKVKMTGLHSKNAYIGIFSWQATNRCF